MVNHFLHYGVPAFLDVNDSLVIQLRPDIMVLFGNNGKRGKDVQPCHCLCRLLDALKLRRDIVPDFAEHIVFQDIQLVLSV